MAKLMLNSVLFLLFAALVPFLSSLTVPSDDYCVKSKCDYEAMLKSGNDPPILAQVGWENSTVVRACSCTAHCAFYGDCCSDSLEFSRQYLLGLLRLSNWSEVIQLRSTLAPKCLELFITGDYNGDDDKSINVQIGAECDSSCYVEDLTMYEGSRADEISERLPFYHEGLGLVFYNINCAKRCYGDVLDVAKLKPLPFEAICNGTTDLQNSSSASFTNVTCHYSLDITKVSSKLAHCLPMAEDVLMQQAYICKGFNMTGRLFVPCDKDSPSGMALSLLRYRGHIYRMCINSSEELALQCGQRLPENETFTIPSKNRLNRARCVPEGGKIGLEWPKFHMLGSASFVRKLQDSDFSYRYMFDVFKLVEAEEVLHNYLLTNSCRSDLNEIFIERWGVCIARKTAPTFLMMRSSPSKNLDWLDFGPSFFQVRLGEGSNDSSSSFLELANDPAFRMEAKCYQYDAITTHIFVSHPCLCAAFVRFEEDRSQMHQFIPREDDLLSFAGSLSIWISLAFLSAAIAIPAICSKLRNRATKMIMLLSTYLCLGMGMVLINVYWNLSVTRSHYKEKQTYEDLCFIEPLWQELACTSVGATLHFTYLATFFLALALYFDLWHSVRNCSNMPSRIRPESSRRFLALAGISGAFPLCIVVGAVLLDLLTPYNEIAPRYSEFVCWITEPKALLAFFVCPVILVFIADLCVFILISRQIRANSFASLSTTGSVMSRSSVRHSETANSDARCTTHRSKLRIYVKMALMMGLTWVIGCLAPVMPEDYGISLVFWYGFVIFNGLQGVFIFYANVYNRKTLRIIREKMGRSTRQTSTENDKFFGNNHRLYPKLLSNHDASDIIDSKIPDETFPLKQLDGEMEK